MPITSKEVFDYSPQSSGRDKARLRYVHSDGREKVFSVFCIDQSDADALLISQESEAVRKFKDDSVNDAVSKDLKVAHGTATIDQVRRAYLVEGMREAEPFRAYKLLKDIVPNFGSRTNAELAVKFELRVDQIAKIKSWWAELNANKAVIQAYALLKRGEV